MRFEYQNRAVGEPDDSGRNAAHEHGAYGGVSVRRDDDEIGVEAIGFDHDGAGHVRIGGRVPPNDAPIGDVLRAW